MANRNAHRPVDIHSPEKAAAEVLLKTEILSQLDSLADDEYTALLDEAIGAIYAASST